MLMCEVHDYRGKAEMVGMLLHRKDNETAMLLLLKGREGWCVTNEE